ncbi:MAG: cobyrinate a,c-diamide synthase [Maritimibacter sp.]
MGRGLIIAAPGSGSGKTTVTLGVIRALRNAGVSLRGAKSGPDYIDPRFHEAASGKQAMNLDAWAMTQAQIRCLAAGDDLLIIEGAMGLFDGAPPLGKGACADIARSLGLPVVLVVDASHMAQSVAALVGGFARHDAKVRVAGVILNKVGSSRHEAMLRAALLPSNIPVLGAVHRDGALALPSRHLGLVQAGEHRALEGFIAQAAEVMDKSIDLKMLEKIAAPFEATGFDQKLKNTRPQTIAIARDAAFAFTYPHQLAAWQHSGATLKFFSPLADDPVPDADWVFLPGGYPELHAGQLAAASTFLTSLRNAAKTTRVYGECGGYMVLGEGLTDQDGTRHKMAGLLGLETSFATRKLHLGYRDLSALGGWMPGAHKAHEFHYATTVDRQGAPLWHAQDAQGNDLGPIGLVEGHVQGSFAHVI